MKIIDRAYVESHRDEIINAIKNGKIFIYPTDTIYGLGTNALLSASVRKIRELKRREAKPFSVIAPSKAWVLENCVARAEDLDKFLPGPYTLFLRRKGECVASEVNPNDNSLGVRLPDHWFTALVAEAGVPFVTTSVNVSGMPHMEKIEDAPEEILSAVDYIVYEGEKKGNSSEKVSLL